MNRVNIRRLVKRPKGTVARLAPLSDRVAANRKYRTALRRMLREMASEVRTSVIPAYQAYRKQQLVRDDQSWFIRLRTKTAELERALTDIVRSILDLESQRHTESFKRQVKQTLGVDLEGVVEQEDLAEFLDDVTSRNVSLIRSLGEETFKRIEQQVLRAKIEGRSVSNLRKDLQKEFGISDRRATLIARDQMAKLTSDLNRRRQEQIGITEYIWQTSRDERVRPRHRDLDGEQFKWGEPTGAEEGLPPGQPIQCRCVAIAVVEF